MNRLIYNVVLLIFATLSLNLNAITVKRVSNGDKLNNSTNNTPSLFIIDEDCYISGNIQLPSGSILKFEGGAIKGKGTISGNRLMIEAPKYQIFGDDINIKGIANGEVSAHWWGAIGDGVSYDCKAINRALQNAGTSWVILENLRYLTTETITMGRGQKLRCDGIISYRGSGAAIDLKNTNIEVDIYELRQNFGSGYNQETAFLGSGVRFSGNVFNSNINIDRILYFNRAFDLSPKHELSDVKFRGIQYCKISWQYIVGEYGIYIDMVSGMLPDYEGRRTWVNENQFNGGRLHCRYGIYSTPVDDKYNNTIGVINGNAFNCIGFEGEGAIKCKAITLYNAWHNNFNDIRLSEGYVPIGETWIDLTQCGYLKFDFKSQIPYSSVKATRCNHIEMTGAFTDNGLGNFTEYDRLYIFNENPAYNPLIDTSTKNNNSIKLLTRSANSTSEIKRIYVGATKESLHGGLIQNINFNDLFYTEYDGRKILNDKCFITVNDKSRLNISTANSLINSHIGMELVCKISTGSSIVITNNKGQKATLTESGTYKFKPSNNNFELLKITDTDSKIIILK